MRTTLDIDDDVLIAVKEIASSRKTTPGKVISELARRGFRSDAREAERVRQNNYHNPHSAASECALDAARAAPTGVRLF